MRRSASRDVFSPRLALLAESPHLANSCARILVGVTFDEMRAATGSVWLSRFFLPVSAGAQEGVQEARRLTQPQRAATYSTGCRRCGAMSACLLAHRSLGCPCRTATQPDSQSNSSEVELQDGLLPAGASASLMQPPSNSGLRAWDVWPLMHARREKGRLGLKSRCMKGVAWHSLRYTCSFASRVQASISIDSASRRLELTPILARRCATDIALFGDLSVVAHDPRQRFEGWGLMGDTKIGTGPSLKVAPRNS